MTDFLMRLVQRTLGASVVQPRLPPMFSLDDGAAMPSARDMASEPPRPSPTTELTELRQRVVPEQPRKRPSLHDRQVAPARPGTRAKPAPDPAATPARTPPEANMPSERALPIPRYDPLTARDTPPAATIEPRRITSNNLANNLANAARTFSDPEMRAATNADPIAPRDRAAIVDSQRASEVPPGDVNPRSSHVLPSPAMPGRSVRADDPEHAQEVDPAGPIVRVTIGRVEVRAIHPPAAPPRRVLSPVGPRLTLAEYLRQRSQRRDE